MKMALELRTESDGLGYDDLPPLYGKTVMAVAKAGNVSYL